MEYVFTDNFAACPERAHPGDWLVERHSDRAHQHGWVENGAYHILCWGNKHLPLTPPLRDFTLSWQCRGDAGASGAGCYVFFRYDSDRQAGYYIKRQWSAAGGATLFGVCDAAGDQLLATQTDPTPRAVHAWTELRLEVRGNVFTVFQDQAPVGCCQDERARFSAPGSIAFDRDRSTENGARGPFWLRQVCIRAQAAPAPARRWRPVRIKFPMEHNGIVSPIYYHLEALAYANHVQITARLTGGPAERSDPVLLRYRGPASLRWQNERLINPFLRLERPGGGCLGVHYLFRGAVGLKEHWDRRAPGLPPADIECPVERIVRLPRLPEHANVFIGYEYYEAEERNWMKGGPTEAWVDPLSGRVLASGAPLRTAEVFLDIRSPANKAVCRMIPARAPRQAQALAFARANHYFLEDERARFAILARHRLADDCADGVRAEWVLEDACRQPLQPPRSCALRPAGDAAARRWRRGLGARTLVSAPWTPGVLPVGVYHAVARLRRGAHVLAEIRRAFEIMPRDPSAPAPPQASGLPELLFYESSDFVSAADPFDPWLGRAVDEGHYVGHNGFPAPFAEKHRAWTLLHLYRRKWWLWLIGAQSAPEDHPDLVRHADLLYAMALLGRFDLWQLRAYQRSATPQRRLEVFDALLEFLQGPEFAARGDPRLPADAIRAAGRLSEDQFVALVESHWKPWLEFFNRWYAQTYIPQAHARLRALRFQGAWSWFAPYPCYGSVYKSAWFPHYMGRDLQSGWTRAINGPMRLESYACVCGYPIQRDVFQLAAMKMEVPELRIYPEIYSLTGIPADFHVMLGSPPYARAYPPARCFRKRFFEYAYAAVWFGARGFEFWRDNGFQPKHWDRDQFAEFLSAWAVIRRVRPQKPLRTAAFVYSRRACREHPDTLDRYRRRYLRDGKAPVFFGDIYNTAEECVAFAYEQARMDSQCAGFIVDLEQLGRLAAANVHTLVLPPLAGLRDADRAAICKAHAAGMSLVAFETVPGLEDLFGVAPLRRAVTLRGLRVNPAAARAAPWAELREMRETIGHDRCRAAYQCRGAQALIEGLDARGRPRAPALVMHRTRWGRTALFTIAPTDVRRETGDVVISYGKASLSRLMNRAMALVLRQVGRPEVEATAGKLIGFRDTDGRARIVIAEDRHPEEAAAIAPEITIRLRGAAPARIRCDRAFETIAAAPGVVRLRVPLGPHDCAMLTVDDRPQ